MAESKEEKKSERASLKLNLQENYNYGIWSYHFMANKLGKMETVTDFIFLGSKITADSDCGPEIKRCFSLEEKLWQT